MYKVLGIILVCVCSMFWAGAALCAPNIQDGLWEVTTTMEMKGMPEGMMKPMTHTSCITQKDSVPEKPQKSECKMTSMNTVGNTVMWTVTCPNSVGSGKITYSGGTFDGVMETTVTERGEKMQMKSRMKGRRIGPCK
jgi:hypothetical protein